MGLFKKLFLLISLPILLILLFSTSLLIYYEREAIEAETDYNMKVNMAFIMDRLEQTVDDFVSLGLSFSNNKEFIAYLESLDLEDERVVNDALVILQKIKASSTILNNVTLTPRGGVIRMDALGAFIDKGPDESQLEYYLELKNNPDREVFINKPLIGTANNQPIFGIGIQMDNQGEFLGILGLPINLNRFMDQYVTWDLADDKIKVLMVNSEGVIVWASDEELIYNEKVNFTQQEATIYEVIKTNNSGNMQEVILGVDALIQYDYYEPFDSYIITYKDIGSYRRSLAQSVVVTIGFGLIALILSGVIIYYMLQQFTKPIDALVAYSQKVAGKDFDTPIGAYILDRKDEIGQLGRSYALMVTSLKESFIKIQTFSQRNQFLANHDELTGLSNRRHFEIQTALAMKTTSQGCVIMMDIDNFKKINDTQGHIVGDQVLREVGRLLRTLADERVTVSRFGGDEFIIFVSEVVQQGHECLFVDRLKEVFSGQLIVAGKKMDVTLSIGAAKYPDDSQDLEALIRQADIALYMAKKNGKNRLDFFEQTMETKVFEKVEIEQELTDAISNDGFRLLYQPQVDLKTGKTICYEALIRLKNGRYNPNTFIPVSEETHQIMAIGRWVVTEAVGQLARWRDLGIRMPKVSINLSGVQLNDSGFCQHIKATLEFYSIEGKYLEIEVTENVFIKEEEKVTSFFNQITDLGVDLAIDDFGTGYSSLTYLVSFPVHKIKLDRDLIIQYLGDNKDHALENLIQLIHSLGYTIVAEGIEVQEDVKELMNGECDYIQGFYFSRPLDPEAIMELDRTHAFELTD